MTRVLVSKGDVQMGSLVAAVMHEPAIWGFMGAFIYAAPRLVKCFLTCKEAGTSGWFCTMEFVIALATGAIAAAAWAALVMGWTHVRDSNAMSATIGLLVNPLAPMMVSTASGVINAALSSKLGRVLQGDEKK